MRIDPEVNLGFDDVMLRPKRSTLNSRSEVDLKRAFLFRGTIQSRYTGIPIIAANMDTVGTFGMAQALAKHGMMTAIHKHYHVDEWKLAYQKMPEIFSNMAFSSKRWTRT